MKKITLSEVEFIAYDLAQRLMRYDEPIPDFTSRFPNILESTLAVPFQGFGRTQAYSGLLRKAAILFYLMVKNHPFQNGNKRIAIATLLVFLLKNKRWIDVSNQEFYNFAIWVAQSPAALKSIVVSGIEIFIRDHLVED